MPTPLGDFHHPDRLCDRNGFKEKYVEAIECAKDGLPAKDICMSIWGITQQQFINWLKYARDDIEAGFTEEESNLIKLILGIAREDAKLHRKLKKKGVEMALDGNTQMLQFILKTSYDYSETTNKKVELTSEEEAPIKFEIVDMQPNDEEEE